jgi:hypothetical protein
MAGVLATRHSHDPATPRLIPSTTAPAISSQIHLGNEGISRALLKLQRLAISAHLPPGALHCCLRDELTRVLHRAALRQIETAVEHRTGLAREKVVGAKGTTVTDVSQDQSTMWTPPHFRSRSRLGY